MDTPAATLTPEELDAYRRQGYVGPFQAFDPGEMASAFRIIVDAS